MAGIKRVRYRNKDGKHKVKYYITFYDETGKQRTSGKSYATKSEAQNHLCDYKDRINDDMVNTAQFVINDIFSHKEKNKEKNSVVGKSNIIQFPKRQTITG